MCKQSTDTIEKALANVPETLRPSALRAAGFKPELDKVIDRQTVTYGLHPRTAAIILIRLYRWVRPQAIGNRCVFEPSCSRYSELAFRQLPFLDAIMATRNRLKRCKPGRGGLDLTNLKAPE